MARSTEKIVIYGNENITNSETATALYTADDDYTLYRIVGNLTIWHQNAGQWMVAIFLRPSGTGTVTLQTATTGATLDGSDAYCTLFIYAGYNAATGSSYMTTIPIDIKAKRRLKEDDTLNIVTRSGVATVATMEYALTMFLLEEA